MELKFCDLIAYLAQGHLSLLETRYRVTHSVEDPIEDSIVGPRICFTKFQANDRLIYLLLL